MFQAGELKCALQIINMLDPYTTLNYSTIHNCIVWFDSRPKTVNAHLPQLNLFNLNMLNFYALKRIPITYKNILKIILQSGGVISIGELCRVPQINTCTHTIHISLLFGSISGCYCIQYDKGKNPDDILKLDHIKGVMKKN